MARHTDQQARAPEAVLIHYATTAILATIWTYAILKYVQLGKLERTTSCGWKRETSMSERRVVCDQQRENGQSQKAMAANRATNEEKSTSDASSMQLSDFVFQKKASEPAEDILKHLGLLVQSFGPRNANALHELQTSIS